MANYFEELNDTDLKETDENLFGIDDDLETGEIEDDDLKSLDINPKTDPKTVTPSTPEDKKLANETPEQKKLREKQIAEKQKVSKVEDDLDELDPKIDKDEDDSENVEIPEIQSISEGLYKAGIFSKETDDEKIPENEEEFLAKFTREKELAAEDLIDEFASRHGEEYQKAFDAIFVDGVSPREYLQKFEDIKSYKEMDMSDESNQVTVVEAALKLQGLEDDFIKNKIKSLKLNAELENEALGYQKALIRREEVALTKMQTEAKRREELKIRTKKQYENAVTSILTEKVKAKEFNGIPVTKDAAVKAADMLTNQNWKLPTGELISDMDNIMLELNRPENYEVKVQLALLFAPDYQPGKPLKMNLGTVAKTAVSKENKEIFNFNKKSTSRLRNEKKEKDVDFLSDL